MDQPSRRAFTLIELSIVLVVFALLIGTVIAGQQMYKNQQMRQILVNSYAYATAFEQFRIKYNALPGDMANATEMWGTVGGGTAQCASPNSMPSVGSNATCNGDGDGVLNWYTSLVAVPPPHETFRAWQHLAAAGLILGNYKGIGVTTVFAFTSASGLTTLNGWKYSVVYTFPGTPTIVLPKGQLELSQYAWFGGYGLVDNTSSADAVFFDGDYTNALLYGKYVSGLGGPAPGFGPALTSEEQSLIDAKNDDGAPATGVVRAAKRSRNSVNSCITGSGTTATYDLTQKGVECSIIFMTTQFVAKGKPE